MRVLIVTAGSRGDVVPFTGLGQRLRHAGHDVALAAHDAFAGLITACGLEHRTLPGDPVEMVRARTAARSPEALRELFVAVLTDLGVGIADAAAAGADVVLTPHGPAPLSRIVSEGMGIPSMGTYLFPGVPTREFPLPGAPHAGENDPRTNLLAGRRALTQAGSVYAPAVAQLRSRFALPTLSGSIDISPPAGWPIYHGYSPVVSPRPADWPGYVRTTGYWWPAVPVDWQPPQDLVEFLDAGLPPVYFGFGSMTPDQSEQLSQIIAAVVARTGVRALIQSGWAHLQATGSHIHPVGDVPHEWLFPRTAAVVHHCGAGTTGAGLRAGVPAVAVPMLVDQPFWASRLHDLGVAPPPIPLPEVTTDALAAAVTACVTEPGYRQRATLVAHSIHAEDGPTAVLDHLATLTTAPHRS